MIIKSRLNRGSNKTNLHILAETTINIYLVHGSPDFFIFR
jgi:hypothetical protein